MPVYEYFCPQCKEKFELLRPIKGAADNVACPTCGTSSTRTFSICATFSTNESGFTRAIARGANSCSSCNSDSCSSCG